MRDLSDCPDGSASTCRGEGGPTPCLSRAAERATMKRHGDVKEYMFANQGWRRRLQAMLGRGLAGDGRSVRLTVGRGWT